MLFRSWRHVSEWVWLAARAGLPAPSYRQASSDQFDEMFEVRRLFPLGTPTTTAIVIQDQVIGDSLPSEIRAGCLRLAALSETPLLGIEFARASEKSWTFAGATPMPDLRLGGEPLLDALALTLSRPATNGDS